jgi:hypothetical protein
MVFVNDTALDRLISSAPEPGVLTVERFGSW